MKALLKRPEDRITSQMERICGKISSEAEKAEQYTQGGKRKEAGKHWKNMSALYGKLADKALELAGTLSKEPGEL